jgi:Calcineurin-like phosphoesterase
VKYTRREFGSVIAKGAGVAAIASMLPSQPNTADPAFTVAVVPDPQYLAGDATCSGSVTYNRLINWAVRNKKLSVGGTPLNIKGFIQVGDCQNTSFVANQNSQGTIMVNAWRQAINANLFVAFCCGNHDYEDGAKTIDRNKISYVWRTDKNGPWRPSALSRFYGSGMDLGSGDVAYWGGAYSDPDGFPDSSVNNYIRLKIGSRKILIISLEFFPRNKVMNWAKSLHDQHIDHECWVTTHGYMDNVAVRCTRTHKFGPDTYSLLDNGTSNSGQQIFSGNFNTPAQPGLANFLRARIVTCGHFVDGWTTGWIWQHTSATGALGQSIEEIFADAQGSGGTGDLQNFCSTDPTIPNQSSSTAHLMLLRIWPTKMEAFMLSTNSGKWIGAQGVSEQSLPVQLWSVPFSPLPPNANR